MCCYRKYTLNIEKTLMLGKIEGRRRGDDRGWDGWMASPTRWMWVWVNSGSWWWTRRPGMLRFMGSHSQTLLSYLTELNLCFIFSCLSVLPQFNFKTSRKNLAEENSFLLDNINQKRKKDTSIKKIGDLTLRHTNELDCVVEQSPYCDYPQNYKIKLMQLALGAF